MLGFEEVKSAGFSAQPSQAIRAVPARSTSSEPNTGFPANVGVSSAVCSSRVIATVMPASTTMQANRITQPRAAPTHI